MGVTIRGTVQQGIGESKNTIHEQMPFFKECFPEVSDCFEATINVALEEPLVVINPDYVTAPLPWHPAFKVVKGGEVFEFLRVVLTIDGFEPVNAWIYDAHFSPYHKNPLIKEILAPRVGFTGTPGCTIEIKENCRRGYVVMGNVDELNAPVE